MKVEETVVPTGPDVSDVLPKWLKYNYALYKLTIAFKVKGRKRDSNDVLNPHYKQQR